MNGTLNWDEFRLIKAIADSHSLVGAAEKLGLNHSTVFRRLTALEAAIGVRLFERSRLRYQPTAAGEAMINVASDVGESIVEFERRVAGRDIKPSGALRVATIDSLAIYVLPPILSQFRTAYPGVQLDLVLSSQNQSLSRREAAVAIRATNGPADPLVGERICAMRWAIYCTPELALRYGNDIMGAAPWIASGENYWPLRGRRWFEKYIPRELQVCRVDTVLAMAELAAVGFGATILPCFIGDAGVGLVRVGELQPELDVELWLLTHAEISHSARVRAFMDFAAEELTRIRPRLEGESGEKH
jgi:DNA-binding transcriptional LysR family regulator